MTSTASIGAGRRLVLVAAVVAALHGELVGQALPPAQDLNAASPQQATLVASDGVAGDRFGASVAIAGDTAFVGAPGAAPGGAVYVFTRSGGTWTQGQKVTALDAAAGDEFGTSLSLRSSSEGITLIVGAPGSNGDAGAAYVFTRVPATTVLVQQQKLTADDAAGGDRFGTSVSVGSQTAGDAGLPNRIAVGAPGRSGGADGGAYVFSRTGVIWSQQQRVFGTGGFAGGYVVREFGWSVAINWSLLIVGAPASSRVPQSRVGAVFPFTPDGPMPGLWVPRSPDPGSLENGRYGSCVAVYEHDALACDGNGRVARGFTRRNEGVWSKAGAGELSPPTTAASALAIAMGAEAAFAGYSSGEAGFFVGVSPYPFSWPHDWVLKERVTPTDANGSPGFGSSVALSGNTRLVGAPGAAGDKGAAYVFLAPSIEPLLVGFGTGAAGLFQSRGNFESRFALVRERFLPWSEYNAQNGELHPATGDLDGDGLDEVVVGLGRGSFGYMAVLDDAAHDYALLKWIQLPWPEYNAANGTIWPALGDLDGDGRAEIVAGLGEGGQGFFAIFDDSLANNELVTWRHGGWPAYNAARGESRPAVANIDGGQFSEIVIGLGPGGDGWLELFDGAEGSYGRLGWLRSSYGSYNAANGETFPAAGDLDEDGFDEVVLGMGSGSHGWLEVLDDAFHGFAHRAWIQVDWPAFNSANGETHPAVGNLDGDSAPEIAVGLGQFAGDGGWVEQVDDAAHGHSVQWWRNVDRTPERDAGVATFPAIGRLR